MANMFEQARLAAQQRQQRAAEIRHVSPGLTQPIADGWGQRTNARMDAWAKKQYERGIWDGMARGALNAARGGHDRNDYDQGFSAGRRIRYMVMNKIGKHAENAQWQERLALLQRQRPVQTDRAGIAEELRARELTDAQECLQRQPLLEALRSHLQTRDEH